MKTSYYCVLNESGTVTDVQGPSYDDGRVPKVGEILIIRIGTRWMHTRIARVEESVTFSDGDLVKDIHLDLDFESEIPSPPVSDHKATNVIEETSS